MIALFFIIYFNEKQGRPWVQWKHAMIKKRVAIESLAQNKLSKNNIFLNNNIKWSKKREYNIFHIHLANRIGLCNLTGLTFIDYFVSVFHWINYMPYTMIHLKQGCYSIKESMPTVWLLCPIFTIDVRSSFFSSQNYVDVTVFHGIFS